MSVVICDLVNPLQGEVICGQMLLDKSSQYLLCEVVSMSFAPVLLLNTGHGSSGCHIWWSHCRLDS